MSKALHKTEELTIECEPPCQIFSSDSVYFSLDTCISPLHQSYFLESPVMSFKQIIRINLTFPIYLSSTVALMKAMKSTIIREIKIIVTILYLVFELIMAHQQLE